MIFYMNFIWVFEINFLEHRCFIYNLPVRMHVIAFAKNFWNP